MSDTELEVHTRSRPNPTANNEAFEQGRHTGIEREASMVMEAGADLVDPGMFLRGCKEPLEQYRECLMKNLKDWNGRYGTVTVAQNSSWCK